MELKPGMVLAPPEYERHRRLKPRRVIAVEEERGIVWVTVNAYHAKIAHAYPIESFNEWGEYQVEI